jgi:ABC-type multidrug transport system fused ATPase/permease subunit
VGQGASDALYGIVVLLAATVTLVLIAPSLSVAALVVVPVLVVSSRMYLRRGRPRSLAVRVAVDETLGAVQRYLAAHRVIRIAGREEQYLDVYRDHSARVVSASEKLGLASGVFTGAFPVAYGLGLTSILAVGAWLLSVGRIQGGTVSASALAFVAVWTPISTLLGQMTTFQSAGVAFRRVRELAEMTDALPEPATPVEVVPQSDIALRDVTFAYVPGVPVLHRITLSIPEGQHVALVGATGAGKSALASIIARTYDPQDGQVLFGGIDVRQLSLGTLRKRIVLVSQETRLLSGTIADNVGLMDAHAGSDDIRKALSAIGALDRFDRLPEGIETTVGEAALSAGERQLLALARLALADPSVVILDEATAQLDPETERLVAAAVNVISQGRTLITIAHRLETTRAAERIVVIDSGRIVEDGPPGELIASGGKYASLWQPWSGGNIDPSLLGCTCG